MNKIALKATVRDVVGKKVKKIVKSDGMIPAVLYGHGEENKNLWVKYLDFSKVYAKAGENAIVDIEIDGKSHPSLVYDTQLEPMSGNFYHVDFLKVNMKEDVQAEIPLEFVGESAAVKALGGVLIKTLEEVEVKCLPSELPSNFVIDISALATFDDQIKVGDIKVPAGVEIMDDMDTVIALVERPRSEEELASLDEKVEADVTKVEGVVKETPAANGEEEKKEKK
ncbi:MAG: 50S ribosomal protein L25 [Candidatus Moranbacteria bacterium GW2011_GWE1_49_15]|nr:MAG: 50S ribosomal protein L25 [Candidatus Moranbacteria bacterium GW2011_GWE2_47_10]KKW06870.1 MAG: 50S ribosomal protein L25 [Candidatus Moranbacteria bacterium GW2011_GWE1_49_15]HBP00933.1 50S ribosomal protein L25 [Candidatus Moranbacteria bacterium]